MDSRTERSSQTSWLSLPAPLDPDSATPPLRLLDTRTLTLRNSTDFWNNKQTYAILSHTWGTEELSFEEIQRNPSIIRSSKKIRGACEQARLDGEEYIWIDSCCIDKSSSSELSEAINSMFAWYSRSNRCYIYLSDVGADMGPFHLSRWFRRAWTLQELIAPQRFEIFSCDWRSLGTRETLIGEVSSITKIDQLAFGGNLGDFSVATRMSWAANREATRPEDVAYSLLGIFQINMPLIYGEGSENAFRRLQQEILNTSGDQSIFAWNFIAKADDDIPGVVINAGGKERPKWSPLLATSPHQFSNSGNILAVQKYESAINNGNLELQMPVYRLTSHISPELYVVLLACLYKEGDETFCVCMLVDHQPEEFKYAKRCSVRSYCATTIVPARRWFLTELKTIKLEPPRLLRNRSEPKQHYRSRCYLNIVFHDREYQLLSIEPNQSYIEKFDKGYVNLDVDYDGSNHVFRLSGSIPDVSHFSLYSKRHRTKLVISLETRTGLITSRDTTWYGEGHWKLSTSQVGGVDQESRNPNILGGNLQHTSHVATADRQARCRLNTGDRLRTVVTFSESQFLDKKFSTLKIGAFSKGPKGWENHHNLFPYPFED